MTVVGIDPSSTHLHVVVGHKSLHASGFLREVIKLDGSGPYSPVRSQSAYDSCVELFSKCVEAMPDAKREFEIFVEAPVVGRGGVRSTLVQAYVSGAIQAAASAYGGVHLVNVQSWKKAVVGSGRADKQAVKQAIISHGLSDDLPQDFYDATAICLYGLAAVRRASTMA